MPSPLGQAYQAKLLDEQKDKVKAQVEFVNKMLGGAPVASSSTLVRKPSLPKTVVGAGGAKAKRKESSVPSVALVGAMTAQMESISELIDMKVAEVEKRWQSQFKKLDDRVKVVEAAASASQLDMEKISETLSALQTDVAKNDARMQALLKKLHGIHAQELESATSTLRQEQESALDGLHGDLRTQSRELIRLKAALEEALAKQDGKANNKVSAGAIEDSLTVLVSELGARVGRLETRQLVRESGSGDGLHAAGAGAASSTTAGVLLDSGSARSSIREDKLQLTALRENLSELTLQLSDLEAEQNYLGTAVKTITASLQAEKQKRQALGLKGDRDDEIASLNKKIQGVGKHASKAIRGLSEGMQDIQHSILALYSWSNSVNAKLYLPLTSLSSLGPGVGQIPQPDVHVNANVSQTSHDEILTALQSSSNKLAGVSGINKSEQWLEM